MTFRRRSTAADDSVSSVEEPGQLKQEVGREVRQEPKITPPESTTDSRLSVSFPDSMIRDMDKARLKGGKLSKAAFIRQCVDEGLRKRGF